MGYTHYWTQTRSFNSYEWAEVCTDIGAILKHVEHACGVKLVNGEGKRRTRPTMDNKAIMFNGSGDDAHETFIVHKTRCKAWSGGSLGSDFCKTARKPYDLAATAVLCYLSSVTGTHDVSSDGHGSNFVDGLAAAVAALPSKANVMDIPMGIMQSDRWTGPWISHEGKNFEVNFCVDGHGYVHKIRGDEWIRFETHVELAKWLDARKAVRFPRGGRTSWGDYDEIEKDIWHAMGSFDKARNDRIAKAQDKALTLLFADVSRDRSRPIAFVRPGQFVRPEDSGTFNYYMSDLLKEFA